MKHAEYDTREDRDTADLPIRQKEFLVGCWHVQPDHHVIADGETGQRRRLEPRLMKLLCLLAGQPGQVLSRESLMAALWPRVIVNENSLTRAVSGLRHTLADKAGEPFIETIPKSGYRLIAPVSEIHCPPQAAQPAPEIAHSRRNPLAWLRDNATTLAAANGMLAAGLLALLLAGQDTSMPDNRSRLPPAAMSAAIGGSEDIVREPEVLRAPVLTTSARERTPGDSRAGGTVVSPDGTLVAFTRRTDEGSAVMIDSLMDHTDPLQVYASQQRISHLQWSPVGNALLFSELPRISRAALGTGHASGRLMLVDLQDLSVRELYRGDQTPDEVPAPVSEALNVT